MKYPGIILFILMTTTAHATDPKIDSLKKLGKAALIDLAVKEMVKDHPGFDYTQYDRITVKANEKSLLVEFTLSVKLKKRGRCYYDIVWVALAGSGSGRGAEGDCDNVSFYKRTKKDQQTIDFVFNAINKSDEIGDVKDNKLPVSTKMTISAHAFYYHVETSSPGTHSVFKVNKLTGKISGGNHKHYARRRDEEPKWEIIRD